MKKDYATQSFLTDELEDTQRDVLQGLIQMKKLRGGQWVRNWLTQNFMSIDF